MHLSSDCGSPSLIVPCDVNYGDFYALAGMQGRSHQRPANKWPSCIVVCAHPIWFLPPGGRVYTMFLYAVCQALLDLASRGLRAPPAAAPSGRGSAESAPDQGEVSAPSLPSAEPVGRFALMTFRCRALLDPGPVNHSMDVRAV